MKKSALLLAAIFLTISSVFAQQGLKNGNWRGALKTAAGAEIPFTFKVEPVAGKQQITILNASERFKVTDVKTSGDSLFIRMPLFDSEFRLRLQGDSLTGQWVRHLGEVNSSIPFTARAGINQRFSQTQKPAFDVSGRWSAIFGDSTARDTTVGEFVQTGSRVTGTFLTTTGDYRYLEGNVSGNQLNLSCFDGGHAFLFTATLTDAQTLKDGKFFSGLSGKDVWTAIKDASAKLPDAYSLTALKPGFKKINFSFPDLNKKKVSLNDPQFKNKVVILQVMGSWCPNCMDETAYLVNYYKKYHNRGVEVVGLAYERTADFARSQKAVLQEKNHFNIPYPLLITGYTSNKKETGKSLPMLANFLAFPTTIIIDKKGDVRKIYTGFSGPGTGNYYTEFVSNFEKLTDDLLAEK